MTAVAVEAGEAEVEAGVATGKVAAGWYSRLQAKQQQQMHLRSAEPRSRAHAAFSLCQLVSSLVLRTLWVVTISSSCCVGTLGCRY